MAKGMIEITSTAREHVTLDELDFHPLVRTELQAELKKWTEALERVTPDRLQATQGKVEILRWILGRMANEIVTRERVKAAATDETP
jgi:hypothetical protein